MVIIAPTSSANADWEGKREVEAVVDVVDGVVVEEAVEEAMEKEQMGIRTKNSWTQTIMEPEPDDESGLKQMLESLTGLR